MNKIIRIFRSRPSMEQQVVVAISNDGGNTWTPIAMGDVLEVESEIINRAAGGKTYKGHGDFDVFNPIVRAAYVKPKEEL